jgi:hypothetical protein
LNDFEIAHVYAHGYTEIQILLAHFVLVELSLRTKSGEQKENVQ